MYRKLSSRLILIPLILAMIIPAWSSPSRGKYHAIRLTPGQDLKAELQAFLVDKKIKACAIVTCVGSLTQSELRYANESAGAHVEGPLEITSLVGCGGQNQWHLHLSVADREGKMYGGHLLEGSIVRTTAEIVIVELQDLVFDREHDPKSGYKELKINEVR